MLLVCRAHCAQNWQQLFFFREQPIDTRSKQIAIENKFDIKYYDFPAQEEQLRKVSIKVIRLIEFSANSFNSWILFPKPNEVVVAVVQNSIAKPTTDPIAVQRSGLHEKITRIVEAAALNKVNVICFQETWHMPFAFCTREKVNLNECFKFIIKLSN